MDQFSTIQRALDPKTSIWSGTTFGHFLQQSKLAIRVAFSETSSLQKNLTFSVNNEIVLLKFIGTSAVLFFFYIRYLISDTFTFGSGILKRKKNIVKLQQDIYMRDFC